jgi:hypothetical protein
MSPLPALGALELPPRPISPALVSSRCAQAGRTGYQTLGRLLNVVLVRVLLGGVLGVFNRVQLVAVGQMSVVAGFFVLAGFRVPGCFAVMLGGFIEVLGSFVMVMMNFVLVAHGKLLHQG